jgi:hypothetical protein
LSLPFLFEIFKRVVLIDAMRLEEAVQLDPCQTEHLAQLGFGDAPSADLFKGETFQSAARQVGTAPPKLFGDIV